MTRDEVRAEARRRGHRWAGSPQQPDSLALVVASGILRLYLALARWRNRGG